MDLEQQCQRGTSNVAEPNLYVMINAGRETSIKKMLYRRVSHIPDVGAL